MTAEEEVALFGMASINSYEGVYYDGFFRAHGGGLYLTVGHKKSRLDVLENILYIIRCRLYRQILLIERDLGVYEPGH